MLLDSMERYDEVLENGVVAFDSCSSLPAVHFIVANTLGKLKRWVEAEKHFKEAIKLNPSNALYYANFGKYLNNFKKTFLSINK